MNNENIIKKIKKEIKTIEKEYDTADWDFVDVDRMNSDEAFNRGYYRALQNFNKMLLKFSLKTSFFIPINKNFFRRLSG